MIVPLHTQVPDREKRNVMNLLLAGGIALPVGGLAVPYALFFVPVRYYANIYCLLGRHGPLNLLCFAAREAVAVVSLPRMLWVTT